MSDEGSVKRRTAHMNRDHYSCDVIFEALREGLIEPDESIRLLEESTHLIYRLFRRIETMKQIGLKIADV